MTRARAWIGLGSNLGDRRANLEGAVEALRSVEGIEVLRASRWIETRAIGAPPGERQEDQPVFLNGVCEIECDVAPDDLLWLLQAIELQFGRERRGAPPNAPRTLDCDLLFYGDEHLVSPALVVPHPRLEDRLFVLEPLCQLDPDRRLPRSGVTVRERVAQLRSAPMNEGVEGVKGAEATEPTWVPEAAGASE